MRGHHFTKLPESDMRPACDCGWLRPKFVELRKSDKTTLIDTGPEFYLIFDCPNCGARWDVRYGVTS